ncbi:hypothetical protein CCAX7_57680 [Capsulimonas corticalis]|uniref:Peptidase M56 domain-containing protein n=1 Tax=Capsulimonas corticalis TaxID=2219043 RepID=A0A9N7L922_9BACT|nr:hypothetical protein CCAX7_57680 [Capsulimonas corticalis]
MFVSLGRFFLGLRLVTSARQGSLALDECANGLARECLRAVGLRRNLDIRRSREGGVAVPITWGVVRPVVLLPAQSEEWSEECLRSVLLHELAHIRRGDWLTQCAATLACAFYWFHPLVWLASRQMREAGERACDDSVLRAGVPPTEYAQRLVDVLKSLPPGANPRTAAIAMALPRETEGRIRAVLTAGVNRRSLSRKWIFAACGLAAVLVLPLSALHPIARTAAHGETNAAPATTVSVVHRRSRGILEFLYWRDLSSRRDPNRPVSMSIARDQSGGEVYQFIDRRDKQTFFDASFSSVTSGENIAILSPTRKAEIQKRAHNYNRWSAFLMSGKMILTDADIVSAQAKLGGADGREPVVKITLSSEGVRKLAAFTESHVGETMGIVRDARMLSAPTIAMPIHGGTLELAGCFRTVADTQSLADRLNAPDADLPGELGSLQTLAATTAASDNAFVDRIVAHGHTAMLPNGAEVSFNGISRPVREENRWNMSAGAWWNTDGAPITALEVGAPVNWMRPVNPKDPAIPYQVSYSIKSASRDRSSYYEMLNAQKDSAFSYSNEAFDREMRVESLSPNSKSCTVRVGVSTEPWRTILTLPTEATPAFSAPVVSAEWPDKRTAFLFPELILGDKPLLWYPGAGGKMHRDPILPGGASIAKLARRFVAVYRDGSVVPLDGAKRTEIASAMQTNVETIFSVNPKLARANIKEFQLQTRAYQIVEFRDIPLYPTIGNSVMTPTEYDQRVGWAAKSAATKSNMQLIGLAIVQYEADHNWKLPHLQSLAQLRRTLASYIAAKEKRIDPNTGRSHPAIGNDVFVSPLTGQPYQFEGALSGGSLVNIARPAEQPLFRDAAMARPFDGASWETVAFVDGHVKGRLVRQ